jgi:RPA family protein
MSAREPAWRVLAHEFQSALEEERGEGDRAASYLLSPLGARMNRVLLSGQLSPPESIGRDESQPFLRAKLTDPTGSVSVTAGGFQPRALAALKAWTAPGLAIVVGKTHLFRGRDGVAYASIRAEVIRPASEVDYRLLLADAVEQTRDRIQLRRSLESHAADPTGTPAVDGYPNGWVDSGRQALSRYPTIDPASFEAPLAAATSVVAAGAVTTPAPPVARPTASVPAKITRAPPPPPRTPPSAAQRAEESTFLDIVDELAESSVDGYADLKEALERAAVRGISEALAEELLNRLEESGAVEEPIVGKLRRA